MTRPAKVALALALGFTAGACSLVVGSLTECQSTVDCASKGPGLVCQDKLCVQDRAGPGDAGPADAGPQVLRDAQCQVVFGDPAAPGVVRLGAVISRTTAAGAVDPRGIPRQNALELAVEQLNAKNALPGRTVVLRVCDDTGDVARATAQAKELLDEGAVALVTSGSTQTLAVADVAVPGGAVVMSLSATSVQIASAGLVADGGAKRVWSTAISDLAQGRALGSIVSLSDGGPARNPACIQQDDIAFNGLYTVVNDTVRANSGNAVSMKQFRYGTPAEIPATVAGAMDAGPDVVVIIAPVSQSGAIFGAWTAPDPVWVFSDNARSVGVYAFDGGLARLAGSEGTGPSTAGQQTPQFSDFQARYQAKFHVDPTAQASYVPNAYDSVLLLAAGALWAQTRGDVNGAGIAQGLTQLSDARIAPLALVADNFTTFGGAFTQGKMVNVAGASGALDFDPATGVAPGPIDVWEILDDGGIATIQTVTNP